MSWLQLLLPDQAGKGPPLCPYKEASPFSPRVLWLKQKFSPRLVYRQQRVVLSLCVMVDSIWEHSPNKFDVAHPHARVLPVATHTSISLPQTIMYNLCTHAVCNQVDMVPFQFAL